jgi:chromatin assembly factor 1 subunit A
MTSIEGSPSRKRNHEAFEDVAARKKQCSESANLLVMLEEQEQRERKRQRDQDQEQTTTLPTPPLSSGNKRDASPAASSVSDLTDAGSITPPRGLSPVNSTEIPTAFAAMDGHGAPPAKKPKLTFQEKELKRINKEIKEREKAEEKARKDAEKKATADEKARKEADKEAERKKKEAEKEEKRAAQEAEKAAKEEKRRKKEEEKQKKEDEKRKKERSQLKLGNFFAIPVSSNRSRTNSVECPSRTSMSPAPQNLMSTLAASAANPAATTPSKPRKTPYEDLFPNFYKKDGVTLAPINRFQRDEEAIEVLHKTIDRHLLGGLTTDTQQAFDAASLFHLEPSRDLRPRGRHYMPVREIMNEFNPGCSSQMAIDLTTTDSQNTQIKRTTELLRKIPMKILHFREDVRPPYTGTYTKRPVTGTKKLARNPLRRDLPNTDYDYDSEAEWVEDEDGEDIKSDGEDEEDLDDGEDMDGFLDDEGAETMNSRRLVVQGDLEPVSTGLCWEDGMKRSTNIKMADYRMEIILGMSFLSG